MAQDPSAATGGRPHADLAPPHWAAPPPPPPPPPPAYPAPPPLYGTPAPSATGRRTNGLAIASMVLGILWIYWLGSLLAVVFGHIALNQLRRNPDQGGRGMAIAGVTLGWIGVGLGILGVIGLVAGR